MTREAYRVKAIIFAIVTIMVAVALMLGCQPARPKQIIIDDSMLTFPQPQDTTTYTVQGAFNDNVVVLVDSAGNEVLLEVENAYDQAYEPGLIITIIKK